MPDTTDPTPNPIDVAIAGSGLQDPEPVQFSCSVAERLSGHRVDCSVPEREAAVRPAVDLDSLRLAALTLGQLVDRGQANREARLELGIVDEAIFRAWVQATHAAIETHVYASRYLGVQTYLVARMFFDGIRVSVQCEGRPATPEEVAALEEARAKDPDCERVTLRGGGL